MHTFCVNSSPTHVHAPQRISALLLADEKGQAQFKAALAGQNPRAILDTEEDTDTLPAELETILRQSSIGRERLFAAIFAHGIVIVCRVFIVCRVLINWDARDPLKGCGNRDTAIGIQLKQGYRPISDR